MGNLLSFQCQICLKKINLDKKRLREQNEDAYLTAIHDGLRECVDCYHKHPTEKNRINRLALHEIYKYEQNKKLNQHRYFGNNLIA